MRNILQSSPIFNASRQWFSIKAEAANDSADISLYDYIGYPGVSADEFVASLGTIKASRINIMINSKGGDVFDGLAIYNSLKNHPAEIHVKVDGIAASIASVIAMAGDSIVMGESTFMLIHNPWTIAIGNAAEMRAMADVLDKLGGSLANVYVNRSGLSVEKITELMNAESMLSAEECVQHGFADRVEGKASKPKDIKDVKDELDILKSVQALEDGGRVVQMRKRLALVERGLSSR